MATIKVKVSEQVVLRRKWELLRAIQNWQDAEPDSDDERECEERMRQAEQRLLQLVPDYTKDFKFFTVDEMKFWLKQELCPDKVGKRVE